MCCSKIRELLPKSKIVLDVRCLLEKHSRKGAKYLTDVPEQISKVKSVGVRFKIPKPQKTNARGVTNCLTRPFDLWVFASVHVGRKNLYSTSRTRHGPQRRTPRGERAADFAPRGPGNDPPVHTAT